LFVATSEIQDGALEKFKAAVRKTIDFLEANGPQLLGEVCIDEQEMRAYTVQLHRDSESILAHWKLADPYQRDVMQYITTSRIDIYGQPSEAVMEGMRRLASEGAVLSVAPLFAGFVRLPDAE
jgi:hypothetical protein